MTSHFHGFAHRDVGKIYMSPGGNWQEKKMPSDQIGGH
jgi:hypothetical protein